MLSGLYSLFCSTTVMLAKFSWVGVYSSQLRSDKTRDIFLTEKALAAAAALNEAEQLFARPIRPPKAGRFRPSHTPYCRAQSTDICAPDSVSPPVLSSWIHKCIRRGGKCETSVVFHHNVPSTKAAIRCDVHSTA